ncbi:cyclic nucleotide-binding domain-containing protein [Shimia sp.]|uniref:Crp/Fnr family transcriptional regulator n=1 Tax=Shimia sp. TaxID=1954381 RepID=UPI00329A3DB6
MTLALDTSFITDGWTGHLSYLLLVLSMLMRRMLWLRLCVIASALVGIAFDYFWLGNPVGVFWQSLLIVVNIGELVLLWRKDHKAQFSSEEDRFRAELLEGLSPGATRSFLDLGRWEDLPDGTILTAESRTPEFLTYLAEGDVCVEADGHFMRVVSGGHFIGEMSWMGGGVAIATTAVQGPARVWRIERAKLIRLRETNSAMMAVVEAGIARDMRTKLVFQNDQRASNARSET